MRKEMGKTGGGKRDREKAKRKRIVAGKRQRGTGGEGKRGQSVKFLDIWSQATCGTAPIACPHVR
jgi:hypothetical protein